MDANKLIKLKEINYKITGCCKICKHSQFNVDGNFGECLRYDYEHLKHTDNKRYLSISAFGRCSDGFEMKDEFVSILHGFNELVEK